MDWLDKAACKDIHIDLFYPPLELKDPNSYYSISKQVCTNCPVWEYCIESAIKSDERWGCWGGTSPQDRKNPSKVPHGTRERYRLGCSCEKCFNAEAEKTTTIDIEKVPKNGQHFDIDKLIFDIFRGE